MLSSKFRQKIYFWRKMRRIRLDSIKTRHDFELWIACGSPSGNPEVIAMIEHKRVSALDEINVR
jgi:hypothetical protein